MIDLERVARRLARTYGEDHGWPAERIERHVEEDWREYLWSARAAALSVLEQLLERHEGGEKPAIWDEHGETWWWSVHEFLTEAKSSLEKENG